MTNYIWAFMIIISVLCSIFTGKTEQLSSALLCGAEKAVQLLIKLFGAVVFWSGIMKIAEKSGLTLKLVHILSPLLSRLFPELDRDSEAFGSICMNVSANLLGIGNAATPFGLKAMIEMQKQNQDKTTATNSMVTFVVMNTASMQLIPTTIGYLRQSYGSKEPFAVIPYVIAASACALAVAVVLSLTFNRWSLWK